MKRFKRFKKLDKDEWCHVELYAHGRNEKYRWHGGYGSYNLPKWLILLIRIFGKEKSFYEK